MALQSELQHQMKMLSRYIESRSNRSQNREAHVLECSFVLLVDVRLCYRPLGLLRAQGYLPGPYGRHTEGDFGLFPGLLLCQTARKARQNAGQKRFHAARAGGSGGMLELKLDIYKLV
jgi:hypothetical protein